MLTLKLTVAMVLTAMVTAMENHCWLFDDLPLHDVIFTSDLLFETVARSKMDCSLHCGRQGSCVTFTFSEGSCRGHSSEMTLNSPVVASTNTHAFGLFLAQDCSDVKRYDSSTSAVHTLHVNNLTFSAFCDQDTDGGRWTVLLKRQDGSVDFNRTWQPFEDGFGDKAGEYWLGLRYMHALTNSGRNYELRVDMSDWDGSTAYAVYNVFRVDGPGTNYVLNVTGYHGTAGDSMADQAASYAVANGMAFTTFDKDNDEWGSGNCAAPPRSAGWWHRSCFGTSPTGNYHPQGGMHSDYGMMWRTWQGDDRAFKTMSFSIRPV